MTQIILDNSLLYSDEKYHKLKDEFQRLSSFAEIADWDRRAQLEVELIEKSIERLNAAVSDNQNIIEREKQVHSEMSFLMRIFASRKVQKLYESQNDKCAGYINTLQYIADDLQESIDLTPNTPKDKSSLMKELWDRKKELQLEKREIMADMKAIRVEARQQSSNIGPAFGKFARVLAASERRSIRLSKENALRPNENRREAIERQLLTVDRRIHWLERIK